MQTGRATPAPGLRSRQQVLGREPGRKGRPAPMPGREPQRLGQPCLEPQGVPSTLNRARHAVGARLVCVGWTGGLMGGPLSPPSSEVPELRQLPQGTGYSGVPIPRLCLGHCLGFFFF